jgi:HEAT repeat protein
MKCSSGRARVVLLAGFILFAIAVVMSLPKEIEPFHEERSLSEWLLLYQSSNPGKEEVESAVRQIGTNALPFLLKWITYDPPGWRRPFNTALARMPTGIIRRFRDTDLQKAYAARDGFRILGSQASPAIPDLTRIMHDRSGRMSGRLAIQALGGIGENGLPPLVERVADAHAPDRWYVVSEISEMQKAGIDVRTAVPALLQYLHSDYGIAADAGGIITTLAGQPSVLLPILIDSLHHTNRNVRLAAVQVLGEMGERSRHAIPALEGVLDERDVEMHAAVTNALQKIAPEFLEEVR